MHCPRCQAENRSGRRFCGKCGAPLALPCSACGFSNEPDEQFCGGCGKSVVLQGPAPSLAAPQAHVPAHLAEKILAARAAVVGERKQVTVLFADVRGSLELIQALDPEDAATLLQPAVQAMVDAIHRYEGTVNRVQGDGIMALFGAPLAHEDHAVRACYAALAMQDAMRRHSEALRRSRGVPLQIRVGLNSGEVVVRAIGSDLHAEYDAVGATTHLAARMEQLASPGTTLLTADTLALAEGYVAVQPLGPVPVKGQSKPVEVYELTGAGAVRTRLQALAARRLTRFVGRSEEMAQLDRALEQAERGHGQVIAVIGEPGVGKTRIFHEFTHSHRIQGWLVVASGSVSYGKATAYLPVIDLLKAYFRIETADDTRRVREKVTGRLLTLDEGLRPELTPLLALLDVPIDPVGEPQWDALDPHQRRQRTLDAVKRLLLRECRVIPVVLVVEDLHWIDAETQALLDSLVESMPTTRLLLLVNYRPEYQHGWSGKSYYAQLRLDALPPDRAEELLSALVGADATLAPLKLRLITQTEGNPFFLEETVRALVETRALAGERGAYRLAADVTTTMLQVAPTVQAVLAARIDRLPLVDKRLLQSAAVIGKDVPFALLQAIADVPDEELRGGLARLQAGEFLYERSLFPELELTFKHALTHEVAYGGLLHEHRRALHARIVDAIEATAGDRLAEQVERLAEHAVRGESWAKALDYLRQAYARLMARSAQREAVAYAEQALAALAHLPQDQHTMERAIDLRFELRHALWFLGEFARVRTVLEDAETLAETLGDRRRQGWVALYMCTWFYGAAEHDRAVAEGQRALTLGESLEDETLRVLAHVNLGQAHAARTDYGPGIETLSRAVALLGGDLMHDRLGQATVPSVLARVNLVRCLVELGRFGEGIAAADEAVRIAEEVQHPGSLAIACWTPGLYDLRRGNLSRAIRGLERGLGIARELDLPTYAHWIAPSLGSAYALTGRGPEALALLEETIEYGATRHLFSQHSLTVVYLAEALLLAGREREALERATEALDLSRARHERGYEAWALRLLGEISARMDPRDERAANVYHEAFEIAHDLGMRPLAAHCHLGLGTLYGRIGERERARKHFTAAAAMYRDMEMTFWLDQVEAALANRG